MVRFPKSTRLHLLFGYITHEKLKNKYKAFNELTCTMENKPSIQEDFSIYRYRYILEEEMIEYDTMNLESRGIDVNKIV